MWVNSTGSPADQRCDVVGVKLEPVRELFQDCRICAKGVVYIARSIEQLTSL